MDDLEVVAILDAQRREARPRDDLEVAFDCDPVGVLADRIPGYDPGDSDWEREMDRRWEAWGLPVAVRQYRVRANGRTYRLDRAIPELKKLYGLENAVEN